MSRYNYAYHGTEENTARVVGRSLSVSHKQSIEICNSIRGKETQRAKTILQEAIDGKQAIPFTRFNTDMGHKSGERRGPGRYPRKCAKAILELIESAESNAQFKGFSTKNLVIKHICSQKAPGTWHYGRQRRRQAKNTHVEIVVEEKKPAPKEQAAKTAVKKETVAETKKPEVKKELAKEPKKEPVAKESEVKAPEAKAAIDKPNEEKK